MDVPRLLAGGLAVNRVAFGASYLARPRNAGKSWIGRSARKPGAQVMVRSQAARDIALGLGALWALSRGPAAEAQTWMLATTHPSAVLRTPDEGRAAAYDALVADLKVVTHALA